MLVFHEFKIENTVLQLINTKRNMELLKNVPHREFLDLSVVYRNVFRIDKAGSESVLIDNSMLKSMGIDIRFHMPDNQVLLPDVFYQLPAVRKVLNCKYRQSS